MQLSQMKEKRLLKDDKGRQNSDVITRQVDIMFK